MEGFDEGNDPTQRAHRTSNLRRPIENSRRVHAELGQQALRAVCDEVVNRRPSNDADRTFRPMVGAVPGRGIAGS